MCRRQSRLLLLLRRQQQLRRAAARGRPPVVRCRACLAGRCSAASAALSAGCSRRGADSRQAHSQGVERKSSHDNADATTSVCGRAGYPRMMQPQKKSKPISVQMLVCRSCQHQVLQVCAEAVSTNTLTLRLRLGLRHAHRRAGGRGCTGRYRRQGLSQLRPVGPRRSRCCVLHALLLAGAGGRHECRVLQQGGCGHGQGALDLAHVVAVRALAQVAAAHAQLRAQDRLRRRGWGGAGGVRGCCALEKFLRASMLCGHG